MGYEYKRIEEKWQKYWDTAGRYAATPAVDACAL